MKYLVCILIIIISISTNAQITTQEGTLLKINFNENIIDTNNTVGGWNIITANTYSSTEYYEKVFRFNNSLYFLKKFSYSTSFTNYSNFPFFRTSLINDNTKEEKTLFNGNYPECGVGPYLSSNTRTFRTNTGMILFNDLSQPGYYLTPANINKLCSINDSNKTVFHVVGKLNSNYLVVSRNISDYSIKYFFEDLDYFINPTFINEITFLKSSNAFSPSPMKAYQFDDSLAIMQFDWVNGLFITTFNDTSIQVIDSLNFEIGVGEYWTFRNNNIYYFNNGYLNKQIFNPVEHSLGEKIQLYNSGYNYNWDIDDNTFASYRDDTLFVYSLAEEVFIKKIDIRHLHDYWGLLIDSPYVY